MLQEWDVRKFKTPVHVWEGLPADNATTQVALSPDERLILTGISAGRDGSGGALVFLDRQTRQLVRRIGMPASVVAVQWHPKLNQIMLGVGACPSMSTESSRRQCRSLNRSTWVFAHGPVHPCWFPGAACRRTECCRQSHSTNGLRPWEHIVVKA